MESYYIVTFETTHHALKFEKTLKGEGISLTLLPVPRRLSSSCGIAARFLPDVLHTVKELIGCHDLQLDKLYLFENEKNNVKFYSVELQAEEE
ncbi:MAG: DUF3343 domain-containing protein [Bacillota bacterium]|nr:DUF3343 domain-containing protein [Bacillota bacterium]